MNGLDELRAKREAIQVSLAADLMTLAAHKVECSRIITGVVAKQKALADADERIREYQ